MSAKTAAAAAARCVVARASLLRGGGQAVVDTSRRQCRHASSHAVARRFAGAAPTLRDCATDRHTALPGRRGRHARRYHRTPPACNPTDDMEVDMASLGSADASSSLIQPLLEFYERAGAARTVSAEKRDRESRVYVNNEFRMDDVDVIGFDYDYTLANYSLELPRLVYRLARDYLVDSLGYPSGFARAEYDSKFAIRGLTVDRKKGLLMKISSFNAISSGTVFRGRRRLSQEEVLEEYDNTEYLSVSYRDNFMTPLNDLFSLPHACVLADIVQYFVDAGIPYDASSVTEDVYRAISFVHKSGILHKSVLTDLPLYLERDDKLRPLLERLHGSNKQMFLLTNSGFDYVNKGLCHLLGKDWRSLFEVVIVQANKPAFYTTERPFRRIAVKRDRLAWHTVDRFKPGHVYAQGCVKHMLEIEGWKRKHVLYFGDSMFSDWVEPRRAHGWTTGGILRELSSYMRIANTPETSATRARLAAVNGLLRALQDLNPGSDEADDAEARRVWEWVRALKVDQDARGAGGSLEDDAGYPSGASARRVAAVDDEDVGAAVGAPWGSLPVRKSDLLDMLEAERNRLRVARQRAHNANFGSFFHSDTSPSLFAFSLMRYVDVYTSHLSNFLEYPDDHRFYPNPKILPHQTAQFAV